MIKNESILCMPLTTWESDFPNSLVQIMQVLSKENKILFVDYEFTLSDILSGISGKRDVPVQRMIGMEERLREIRTRVGGKVYVLTPPPVLPINWIKLKNPYRALLQLNSSLIKSSISNALKHLGMENPIVVNGYNPFFGLPLTKAFNEILNVYYCYDEIKGDPFYSFHGPEIEKEYIKKTDGVIVTSEALLESKCPHHSSCYVVKNGVDFKLFNSIANYTKPENSSVVVGYAGSIDERFDIETMEFVIEQLPKFEFLFVGRVTNLKARKKLQNYSNVTFTGPKRPDDVPAYMKDMDVCVIPYIKNEVTRGVYPLKVNEYLAAGKPVVMTDFARIKDFGTLVKVAENKEAFLSSIKESVKLNDRDLVLQRISFASRNSWEQKAEEFSEALEALRIKKFILK